MTRPPATRLYRLHGLRVRSTLALPGFAVADDDACDVDVRLGPSSPVPAEVPRGRIVVEGGPEACRYVGAHDGRVLTLRLPGVCDFVVDASLREVECRPDPATDPRFVAILVGGLVVSVVLNIAGHCVLHASAVEVDGRAIALAGPRGAGKSTLAALLCAAGARLVTDDVLRLAMDRGPVCVGGSPQLRLRAGADWVIHQFPTSPPSSSTVDLRTGITPPSSPLESLPLAVVILPHVVREARAVELRRLRGADALVRMVGALRVPGWKDTDVMRQQFLFLGRTVGAVPVVEATLPWGPDSRSSIAPALLELVDGKR